MGGGRWVLLWLCYIVDKESGSFIQRGKGVILAESPTLDKSSNSNVDQSKNDSQRGIHGSASQDSWNSYTPPQGQIPANTPALFNSI